MLLQRSRSLPRLQGLGMHRIGTPPTPQQVTPPQPDFKMPQQDQVLLQQTQRFPNQPRQVVSLNDTLTAGLGKLEKKLSNTVMESSTRTVLNEIQTQVSDTISKLPSNSSQLLDLQSKSDDDLKMSAIQMVMDLKPKYQQALQPQIDSFKLSSENFQGINLLHDELRSIKGEVQLNNPSPAKKQQLEDRFVEILGELGLEPTYRDTQNGPVLNLNAIPNRPQKPVLDLDNLIGDLSPKKQRMVNSLLQGMQDGLAQSKNRIGDEGTISLMDVPRFSGAHLLMPDPPPEIPNTFHMDDDKFTLQRVLGEGGGGIVFAYQSENTGRDVVLKLDFDDPTAEALAHSRSQGDNVVDFYGGLKAPSGGVFIVMERAQTDLEHGLADLRTKGTPEQRETAFLSLSHDLIHGLKGMHDQNASHGDIKGANLFISNDGSFKLADFGQTKVGGDLTGEDSYGTALFNAPETLQLGATANRQLNDVFSAGRQIYEMYTGTQNPPHLDTQEKIISFGFRFDNRVFANPQNATESLINAMMHPDPGQRPTLEAIERMSLFDAVRDGSGREAVNQLLN